MKDKSYIIILGAEKAFDKIQHPFMTDTQQTGYIRLPFNLTEVTYEKPTVTSYSMTTVERFSSKTTNKKRVPILIPLTQIII